MTQLTLRVNQPHAYGYMEAGAIVTVRRLSGVEGHTSSWWTARQAVDIAGDTNGPRSEAAFELPGGGRYAITVTRPRETDFEREFVVKEGEVRRETIVLEQSPHEYLGWHQFAGIVSASSRTPRFEFAPAPMPSLVPLLIPKGRQAWTLNIARIAPSPIGAATWSSRQDSEFTVWSSPPPPANAGYGLIDRLRQSDDPLRQDQLTQQFPRWVGIESNGATNILSIPWAWWGATPNEREGLRIVHSSNQRNAINRAGHTVVTLLDTRWFALLEFLSSNRLGVVGDLVDEVLRREGDSAEMALHGKVKGPLVAVAGALALVIRTASTEQQRWDQWLENLANWFEGVPDGPIILAYRRLTRAKNRADLEQIYQQLRLGIDRGIPYFSSTILMLGQALAQVANDLPDADHDRRVVAAVSSRVDPNQPFTVIHS